MPPIEDIDPLPWLFKLDFLPAPPPPVTEEDEGRVTLENMLVKLSTDNVRFRSVESHVLEVEAEGAGSVSAISGRGCCWSAGEGVASCRRSFDRRENNSIC